MHTRFIIILFSFAILTLSAHNTVPISKISTINKGLNGRNIVWDFSSVHTETESELRITYLSADSSRIRIYDGNTHFYLHCSADTVFADGYENRTVRAANLSPELWSRNLNFGDSCFSRYSSRIEYSHQIEDSLSAYSYHTIDGSGLLILPDTKATGYRAHHHRDLTLFGKDTTMLSEDTYLWYCSGCKWPAVVQQEVAESINGTDSIIMRNAWYIEQEGLSVPADRENIVALQQQGPLSALCHYPNPVEATMFVCYALTSDANVSLVLSTSGGLPVLSKQLGYQASGEHIELINIGACPRGTYELRIVAGESQIGETVIKL